MDFQLAPEEIAFRDELRAFLKAEVPVGRAGAMSSMGEGGDDAEADAFEAEMRQKLADRGWLTMGWPKAYGGQDASPLRQTVFMEEMSYHDAPGMDLMGVGIVGPTIMKVGSEEQRRLHLQRIARGEVKWAQGFSEPGAGSDLASMSTRAELQGDVFIVNGQKIWSSGAHKADYLLLLCRTDPDVPKHKGISALMVDLKNTKQGLDIRPILNMNNQGGFNECFFDNMEVPRENLLGEINQGWYYAMGLLESERSSFINFSAVGRSVLDSLTELMRDGKALGVASAKRPEIRSRLADAAIELSVGRNLAYHVSWMASKGISPDYQASVAKVFNTETFKRVAVTAMQIIGLYGQLQDPRVAPLMGRINSIYYTSIGMTIAGGTSEIQRNVIATRGLGLPR